MVRGLTGARPHHHGQWREPRPHLARPRRQRARSTRPAASSSTGWSTRARSSEGARTGDAVWNAAQRENGAEGPYAGLPGAVRAV